MKLTKGKYVKYLVVILLQKQEDIAHIVILSIIKIKQRANKELLIKE